MLITHVKMITRISNVAGLVRIFFSVTPPEWFVALTLMISHYTHYLNVKIKYFR